MAGQSMSDNCFAKGSMKERRNGESVVWPSLFPFGIRLVRIQTKLRTRFENHFSFPKCFDDGSLAGWSTERWAGEKQNKLDLKVNARVQVDQTESVGGERAGADLGLFPNLG